MKIKNNSLKSLLIHIGIIIGLGIILITTFFYIYLPVKTNHGESITVPDLTGLQLEELNEFLLKRDLRYEVTPDSGFSAQYPAFTVLSQTPKPGDKVKENRKIYISINAKNPPKIKMPKLVDGSLKNAQMVLESYDLKLGEIIYEPHEFQNAVLKQQIDGKIIEAGTEIPKGSVIDLVIGNGLGRPFSMPDLSESMQEEAEFIIKGNGLRLGTVNKKQVEDKAAGLVIQQYPEAGESVRTGGRVDIWVVASKTEDDLIVPEEQ
ncbi:PASTA domain-containing protein [Marivirga sp. S37H4]|uniref:PASTA domain-containing protein n=1 Tax=Marivirga aurantiaca TaxID=2802615 RepID=A0A934WXT1_9BACT|nr:PASTA domain-containing protein [Marivirga aurantiaca]MBK6264876.1 PASTA domain-containing protein [Marivirga aurantiaca]